MIKKSICLLILAAAIFNGTPNVGAVAVPRAYSPFYEYAQKSVNAVFVGNSGVFTSEVEMKLCEFIEDNFKVEVIAENVSENKMTAAAAEKAADAVISKKPDIIYYQVTEGSCAEVEGFVRKVLKAKKNTIIIFITMPGDNNEEVLKVADYYGAESIDFDAYTERRTKAGVMKNEDLYSGEKLTEQGVEKFLEYSVSHYKTTPYIFASYPERALTKENDEKTDAPEINEKEPTENKEVLSQERAKALLESGIVINVKKDRLITGGKEILLPDKSVAPATYGTQVSFPVKLVKKLFGCKVLYEGGNGKITISNGDAKVEFYCGGNIAYINGEEFYSEHRILKYEDITYIPQAVLEKLIEKDVISNGETCVVVSKGTVNKDDEQTILNYAEIMINGGEF